MIQAEDGGVFPFCGACHAAQPDVPRPLVWAHRHLFLLHWVEVSGLFSMSIVPPIKIYCEVC